MTPESTPTNPAPDTLPTCPHVTTIGLHGIPPFRPRSILRRLVAMATIFAAMALVILLGLVEVTTRLLEALAGTDWMDSAADPLSEARSCLTDWLSERT